MVGCFSLVGKIWKGRIMEGKKKGKREGEKHGVGDKWFELDTLMKERNTEH